MAKRSTSYLAMKTTNPLGRSTTVAYTVSEMNPERRCKKTTVSGGSAYMWNTPDAGSIDILSSTTTSSDTKTVTLHIIPKESAYDLGYAVVHRFLVVSDLDGTGLLTICIGSPLTAPALTGRSPPKHKSRQLLKLPTAAELQVTSIRSVRSCGHIGTKTVIRST